MNKEASREISVQKANVLIEPGGHIVCFNDIFHHLWKISSPSTIVGKNITQFFNDADRFSDIMEGILASGSWSGALRAIDENDARFSVNAQCDLISNYRGESLYMLLKCWPDDPPVSKADGPIAFRDHGADSLKKTILLVEDDDLVRTVIYSMLEDGGYHVISSDSGSTALKISNAYEGKIDVLVTDIHMPGMDGKELARMLTASRPGVRVVFMSGHHRGYVDSTAENDINTPFLRKPFTAEILLKAVQGVLGGEPPS